MIATDEDALICDFAEYYHIYDYRALPAGYAATLACGLSSDSRIKRKLSGMDYSTTTLLMAAAIDRLSLLWWSKTKDGAKGKNRPKSLFESLQRTQPTKSNIRTFKNGEELMRELQKRQG